MLDKYIASIVTLQTNAAGILHTNDRLNMKAYYEKLVAGEIEESLKVKNETWADVVETQFEIDFWPFIQSNQTKTCVNAVMATSPMNLFKLGAHMGLSVSILGLLILSQV